jgi:hypothetical protein
MSHPLLDVEVAILVATVLLVARAQADALWSASRSFVAERMPVHTGAVSGRWHPGRLPRRSTGDVDVDVPPCSNPIQRLTQRFGS